MKLTIESWRDEVQMIIKVTDKLVVTRSIGVFNNLGTNIKELVDRIQSTSFKGASKEDKDFAVVVLKELKEPVSKLASYKEYLLETGAKEKAPDNKNLVLNNFSDAA